MTTIYADNFSDIGTTVVGDTLVLDGWSQSSSSDGYITASNPRRTGVQSFRGQFSEQLFRNIESTNATIFMSFAFRLDLMPTGFVNMARLLNAAGDTVLGINVTSAGEYVIRNGTNTYTSATGLFTAANWYWIQAKVFMDNSVGTVELRDENGNTIITATGVDTLPGSVLGFTRVSLGPFTDSNVASSAFNLTDLHIWDGGGSICNDFTLPTQIDTLRPNGAGAFTEWTPSTGNNWQCVDENIMSQTDYVETSGQDDEFRDLYTFADLAEVPEEIYSVFVTAQAFRDNAGPGQIRLCSRSGTTLLTSTAFALPALGTYRVFYTEEADPDTGNQWTATGFNAAQFGFEVETA